ncbi:MAG: asparagine synthase (glutamine-hydrolyzing) [Rhodospirillales bacterium]|jgi:asparagine synthase (glutamine-hydrolysing)|nr:asparagine synthase (glutamine-hydrolyzing) [Rhodospirillales bacterium]
MCGIAAIFSFQDNALRVDAGELDAIRDHMTPRGPDGAGSWVAKDGAIGLAHRRLAIIDLSDGAAQPMEIDGGRYRITFNGEIYNYRALRDDLLAKGVQFKTQSDTEVVAWLYAMHGESAVSRLRGMFAFAIWDETKRGLFVARDPLGIKPLYYADDGKTFRAASQVKALIAGGKVETAPDPAGHVGFFLFGHVPEPHTLYNEIHALPAGHTLWVDSRGVRALKCYFDVPGTLSAGANGAPDVSLRDAVLDSIRHHLVADVPVGVFLSSGIDSTVIAALASEIHGAGLNTITLAFAEFAGTAMDEAPLAEEVARACNASHQMKVVSRHDFLDAREHILESMDQPSIDGVNTYFVARAAAETGLKVALSGLGGDELFGGYDTFRQVPKLVGMLDGIPGMGALGRAFRVVSAPVAKRLTSPKFAGLLEYGTRYGDAYLLRRGLYAPWELPDVLDPDFAAQGWQTLEARQRLENTHNRIPDPRQKIAALEMCFYMRNQLLRDADWAGMAHSLEIRVPLVDGALLRALGQKAFSKTDLAATPATALPKSVLNKPKTGFFIPVQDWLTEKPNAVSRGYRGWAGDVYKAFRC